MMKTQAQTKRRPNTKDKIKRACHFCVHALDDMDYREVDMLRRYTSSYGKIVSRKRSGVCAKHQRKLAAAIKRARVLSLLPFVVR